MSDIAALERRAAGGNPDQAAVALVELGLAHQAAGRPDLAEDAYLRAIATRHDGQAPRAAFELAQLYEEHDERDGAREAYRFVLEHGGDGVAGAAVCGLRRLSP